MDELLKLLAAIDKWLTHDRVIMLYYVFNCTVQSMPDPNGNKLYRFAFKFMHLIAGNINMTRKAYSGVAQTSIKTDVHPRSHIQLSRTIGRTDKVE